MPAPLLCLVLCPLPTENSDTNTNFNFFMMQWNQKSGGEGVKVQSRCA